MSDSPISPRHDTRTFNTIGEAEAFAHDLRRKDPPTAMRRYKPCRADNKWFVAVSNGDSTYHPVN